MKNKKIQNIALSGLLSAIAILIPLIMPFKIMLPASTYTLASHVPIFIAMFISPSVAIMVTLGSALGFFISFPFIVALRALSHLSFVIIGSLYLQKHPLNTLKSSLLFNIVIGIIPALAEYLVVVFIMRETLTNQTLPQYFLFLGIGTFLHSFIDFTLSLSIFKALNQN